MSSDIVDDLHEAEDRVGLLETTLARVLDSLPAHWHDDVVDEARQVLADKYARPSCDEDCADDCCGSPRHVDQEFNYDTEEWEDMTTEGHP